MKEAKTTNISIFFYSLGLAIIIWISQQLDFEMPTWIAYTLLACGFISFCYGTITFPRIGKKQDGT